MEHVAPVQVCDNSTPERIACIFRKNSDGKYIPELIFIPTDSKYAKVKMGLADGSLRPVKPRLPIKAQLRKNLISLLFWLNFNPSLM
jgi:hypothetical protein